MLKFTLGFVVLLISVGLVSSVAYDVISLKSKTIESKLQTAWHKDMKQLEDSKKLPKGWSEISEVKYNLLTPSSKGWIKKISAPVKINKDGGFLLEVTLTDWTENDRTGVVVQYHLIDKSTGDMTSEFGRTYIF